MNFDEIIKELDERKSTHPNLSTIWTHYLKIKKQKLEKAILDAKIMLNIMEDTGLEQDITLEMIYLISLVLSSQTDTNINII